MSQSSRPGKDKPPPRVWYARLHGQQIGPITSQQLRQLAREGKLRRQDLVSRDLKKWHHAEQVKGLEFAIPRQEVDQHRYPEREHGDYDAIVAFFKAAIRILIVGGVGGMVLGLILARVISSEFLLRSIMLEPWNYYGWFYRSAGFARVILDAGCFLAGKPETRESFLLLWALGWGLAGIIVSTFVAITRISPGTASVLHRVFFAVAMVIVPVAAALILIPEREYGVVPGAALIGLVTLAYLPWLADKLAGFVLRKWSGQKALSATSNSALTAVPPVIALPGARLPTSAKSDSPHCALCGVGVETVSQGNSYRGVACKGCRTTLSFRRGIAYVIDNCVLMVLALLGGLFIGAMVGGILWFAGVASSADRAGDLPRIAGFVAAIFAVLLLALWHSKDGWFQGRSVGKLFCGLKVVKQDDSTAIGLTRSIVRNLPFWLFSGIAWIVVSSLGVESDPIGEDLTVVLGVVLVGSVPAICIIAQVATGSLYRFGDRLARTQVILSRPPTRPTAPRASPPLPPVVPIE